MRRGCMIAVSVGSVILWSGVFGCSDAKDLQIQALQEDLQNCEQQRKDALEQLNLAQRDADTARQRALELQQQVDALRRQLAETPKQEGGWTVVGPYAWTDIEGDILFDPGKATLKPEARKRLEEVARVIKEKYADRNIWIIGHTDSDPIRRTKHLWKDNLDLSMARAYAVEKELIKLGLDPKRMIAGGQGEYNPRAPNDTKKNKALNRRVQIIAVARPEKQGG